MLEKDFLAVINQASGGSAYDCTATVVRVEDGVGWVHIPGGVDETPATLAMDAEAGDLVRVHVEGGKAWVTGNATSPATDDATALIAKTTATDAQTTATTAYTVATDAIEDAAAAHTAATDAQTSANAAQESADNAQESADTAYEAAQNAISDAAVANAAANAAQTSADSAYTAATAAQESADKAQTSADSAQESANSAQATADKAQESADSAQTSANAAQESANAAQESADSAQTSANAAQESANSAQATADKAQESAEAAQESADSAQTSAENAQTSADSAYTAATDAQESADTAEKAARASLSNLLTTEKAAELAETASGELSEWLDDVSDEDAIVYKAADGVHVTDPDGISRAILSSDNISFLDEDLDEVATFGEATRIGSQYWSHVEIDPDSIALVAVDSSDHDDVVTRVPLVVKNYAGGESTSYTMTAAHYADAYAQDGVATYMWNVASLGADSSKAMTLTVGGAAIGTDTSALPNWEMDGSTLIYRASGSVDSDITDCTTATTLSYVTAPRSDYAFGYGDTSTSVWFENAEVWRTALGAAPAPDVTVAVNEASTANSAAQAAQQVAETATENAEKALELSSIVLMTDNGATLKNSSSGTTISATVFHAGNRITTMSGLTDEFGDGAYLEWSVKAGSDESFSTIPATDSRLSEDGFALTLTPDDIDDHCVVNCDVCY